MMGLFISEKVELYLTILLSEQIILRILKVNEVVRVIEMTRDREKRSTQPDEGGLDTESTHCAKAQCCCVAVTDHLGNVRVRYVDKDDSGERGCASHRDDS